MTDLDPAAIMAAHVASESGQCMSEDCYRGNEDGAGPWPCEAYRLAAALAAAQAELLRRSDYDAVVQERNQAQAQFRAALAGEGA